MSNLLGAVIEKIEQEVHRTLDTVLMEAKKTNEKTISLEQLEEIIKKLKAYSYTYKE